MNKNRNQSFNFAMEAIPILFHSQTTQFMKYLDKDGIKFLNFWWNHVGDDLPEDKRFSSSGMVFTTEKVDEKTRIVYITLPSPKEDGDPYFLGLIARPEKRIAWVKLPTTEAYVLVRDDKCGQANLTSLGYLTPNGLFRPRGIGLKPTLQDFKRIVKTKMQKKKTEKVK